MIISRVRLENWKNFHNCDVKISDRCFVVGANASGKSNFLDAFRFLHDLVRKGGGLQQAVEDRGGVTKIRCLAARNKSHVLIAVELKEQNLPDVVWSYELMFTSVSGGIGTQNVKILMEKVTHSGQTILYRQHKGGNEDTTTLKYTHLEQPTANKNFRELTDFFQRIEYLNIIPQLVRETGTSLFSLKEDSYGRNFISRMARLNTKIRTAYFKKINDILPLAVPQLEDLKLVKDTDGVSHLEARYKHWRARGSRQQEMQFSDGTLRLIGFLFALIDSKGLTLLEEPESNLHTAIVSQLPQFLSRVLRNRMNNRQVILTTHSYEMLSDQGISDDEVLLLTPSMEGTCVRNVSDIEEIKVALDAGFSMADVVIPSTGPERADMLNQQAL